ncbi:hypothetical protein [Microbulbifer rhizosphaerae]|uniref:Uncharacterized protein n=1 Tax=Microbulbifer rhizosphaerae TaxID=1562603 RepID=A0A7W4W9W6_9GAMM|nr:hypothetical protein [Microbulbifer rhizosphaerae]MBB3059887.1 hypothetical protein [Microbulbifer rhizosphaerae]
MARYHPPIRPLFTSTHDSSSIRQHFHRVVDEPARFEALCRLLLTYCPLPRVQRGILQHQRETQEVADILGEHGFSVPSGQGGIASDQVGKIKVQERKPMSP